MPFTLKPIAELPATAKPYTGRVAAPTQFDANPLKVDQLYAVECSNLDEEIKLLTEARRWASRQTPVLGLRKAGMDPRTAIDKDKRTVIIQAYTPAKRGPRESK
jgi:hypothetical protein